MRAFRDQQNTLDRAVGLGGHDKECTVGANHDAQRVRRLARDRRDQELVLWAARGEM